MSSVVLSRNSEAVVVMPNGLTEAGSSAHHEKREGWARWSKTDKYIEEMGWYARWRDAKIVRDLIGQGPGRSLDLPCGSGRYFDLQREQGFDFVGADYSPTMLLEASKAAPGKVLRADIFHPPFPPNSFDVILISRLMFHYSDPVAILQSVAPLLQRGGRIVFDTLNTGSLRWLASHLLRSRQKKLATRLYFENPAALAERIRAIGLEVRETRTCYVLPTRVHKHLPRALVWLLHGVEKLWPSRHRVITFWQVERSGESH